MQRFTTGRPGQTYAPMNPALRPASMRPITPGVPAQTSANPASPNAARPTTQFIPDAQYLAAAAQAQFNRQTQLDQLQAQDEAERTQTTEAIRRLMDDAGNQRQQTTQTAAKQGLFYSGQLGKRLGDLESQVSRQRADIQSSADTNARARAAARQAILSGAPLDQAALLAEAIGRQTDRDTTAAQNRQLVPTPVKPKPKPKKKPKKKKR